MSSKCSDILGNQYYVYHRRFLTIVGLWPYQSSSERLRYVCVIFILMTIAIIAQVCVLLTSEWNIHTIAELMQTFLPTLSFTPRYCYLLYNLETIRESFDRIRNDWKKLKSEEELIMMQEYAAMTRLFCLATICVFYIYSAILTFPSLLSIVLYFCDVIDENQLVLPVNSEAFVANKFRLSFMFSLELLIISIVCKIGIASCVIFLLYIQHICAIFNVVTIRIHQPFKKNPYKFHEVCTDPNEFKKEYDWIVAVIKAYNDVINFVELIKLLYKKLYFLDLLIGFLCIIQDFIYLFQVLDSMVTFREGIKNCAYIIGSILLIYAYAYCGQKLIDHSSKIHTKCCLIPFYALPIKTNKLLIALTMRSTKPCYFSISGLAVVSHSFFTKLIKTSFSFATLCYKMR